MLDNLYENIGGKIKNCAKWIFIIEAIGAIIIGFSLFSKAEYDEIFTLYGLIFLICGPIVAWVGSWILYAFGELVEDVHAIRNKEGTTEEEKAKREEALRLKREAEEKARIEFEEMKRLQKENESLMAEFSDDDYVDIACPKCKTMLSFLKTETNAICPECNAEFKIK